MSDVFKALSHASRRDVLVLLRERALPAGEIADHLGLTKPTLSGHLNILKHAGLVHEERLGTVRLYRLNLSVAEEALMGLMDLLREDKKENTELRRSGRISWSN